MKRLFLTVLPLAATLCVCAQTYRNGTWYSVYDDETHTMNTQGDYETGGVFAPTAGTLNVQWRYEWIDWLGVARKVNTQVQESADGGASTYTVGMLAENTSNGSNTSESFSVSPNINWIKFNRPNDEGLNGPTHKVHVDHFDIPLARHILIASGTYGTSTVSHNFGETDVRTVSEVYTVQLRSFLTAGDITITSSDPAIFHPGSAGNTEPLVYAVGANACASANGTAAVAAGGTLGKISNYAIPVYFTPQEGRTYGAVITISDGVSTATVALTGTGHEIPTTYYAYSAAICEGDVYGDGRFEGLTEGGVYRDTVANVQGGDSVITFELTVHPVFRTEETLSIETGTQESWQHIDLSQLPAGDTTLVAEYTTIHGCDSVYMLHLTVTETALPVTYGADTIYTCAGEAVEYAGKVYTRPAQESVVLSGENYLGGDSVVALVVSVLPSMRMTGSMTITEGDTAVWQDIDLSQLPVGDTTLTASYTTVHGCDSVYILHLTVIANEARGLDEVSSGCKAEKFFRNGQLYIRKDERVYTLQGVPVENRKRE